MGSLIVDLDAKLSYHKGALEIRPFIGRKALQQMHGRIIKSEEKDVSTTSERLELVLGEQQEDWEPEPVFKASSENLDEIFVIDASFNISGKAVNLLTEQLIPVYWIRNGELAAKIEPIPAHGSAQVRIAQVTSPAQMTPSALRKFSKKQIQKLRKPLKLRTKELKGVLQRIETVEQFLKIKDRLLRDPHLKNDEEDWASWSRPPDPPQRRLLNTILSCILSFQISLSGLLPHGKGYFGSLLRSLLIESEVTYLDIPLLKNGNWKQHLHRLLLQIEGTGLRKRVFSASVRYARLCKDKKQIHTPGLLN